MKAEKKRSERAIRFDRIAKLKTGNDIWAVLERDGELLTAWVTLEDARAEQTYLNESGLHDVIVGKIHVLGMAL